MPEEQEALQSFRGWEVNTLRLTTFVGPDFDVHPDIPWWNQVVEHDAEESRSRRSTGELLESGSFEGKQLVLDIKPGRADWRFSALAGPPGELPEVLPTIGPLDDLLPPFLKLTEKWLEVCPTVTRMAFGVVLIKPVPDRETGYSVIDTFLPDINIDPENSFDFLYQINRPRNSRSGIGGLKRNRLSKWGVLATTLVKVTGGGGGAGIMQNAQPLRFFCRLELDMSTDLEFSEGFSRDNRPAVFRELVDLGHQIAEEGDIP